MLPFSNFLLVVVTIAAYRSDHIPRSMVHSLLESEATYLPKISV